MALLPLRPKDGKFTEAQQKEIVERMNEAYDKGGVDTLHLVVEAANQIATDSPQYRPAVLFVLHLVEVLREKLQRAVETSVSDTPIEEDSRILVP